MLVSTLSVCHAQDISTDRTNRLAFGYVLYISEITTEPLQIAPGENGILKFNLENMGDRYIRDVRIELTLPIELAAYQDTSRKKIDYLAAGSTNPVTFKLIAIPNADEGVYKIPVNLKYLNPIGDERNENNTISLSIGSAPVLIAELKSSEIYSGNLLGNIKIKVINDNVGNVKFLKVNLEESPDYKIIGSNLDYIGDLNSDDFSEVSFKINIQSGKKSIVFPITLSYKDSLNRDYNQKLNINFNIPTAKEAGIKTSKAGFIIIILIIAVVAYFVYRKYIKSKLKNNKKALYSINSKI